MRKHPWVVVDTYGEQMPIGCWTEAAARALPARITAPHEHGRWVVVANVVSAQKEKT